MRNHLKLAGSRGPKGGTSNAAFTLIELLVVIAIIGVLAGLLLPISGIATTKMRIARVKAELNNYITAIESYKSEVGEYPPDNGLLRSLSAARQPNDYRTNAALSPLYYELTGAVFTNQQFHTVAGEVIRPAELKKVFNQDGIRNSARSRANIEYKGFSPKPSQTGVLHPNRVGSREEVEIFVVPVPGPVTVQGKSGKLNPWFYDASSTNRHNRASFDLWAEILVGGKTNIIGNWKN